MVSASVVREKRGLMEEAKGRRERRVVGGLAPDTAGKVGGGGRDKGRRERVLGGGLGESERRPRFRVAALKGARVVGAAVGGRE